MFIMTSFSTLELRRKKAEKNKKNTSRDAGINRMKKAEKQREINIAHTA